jgi:multidrug efflux pump subunit AcrA (membrane-fusion protein)
MRFGFVFLSIILALSLVVASAEQVQDKVNATSSLDQIAPTGNITQESRALLNDTNTTDALNSTKFKNETILENLTMPENVSSKNKVVINASAIPFDIEPSGKAVFVIDDGVTPIKREVKTGQSSINGASLMRAVDRTPHGYTTYYN